MPTYSFLAYQKEIEELREQNKRYREALEAIAYFEDKEEGEVATRIDVKYIARKALEVNKWISTKLSKNM